MRCREAGRDEEVDDRYCLQQQLTNVKVVGQSSSVALEVMTSGEQPAVTSSCAVTCEMEVCKFSEWGEWTACAGACGGQRKRSRTMEGKGQTYTERIKICV